jgi:hypothetical protein
MEIKKENIIKAFSNFPITGRLVAIFAAFLFLFFPGTVSYYVLREFAKQFKGKEDILIYLLNDAEISE